MPLTRMSGALPSQSSALPHRKQRHPHPHPHPQQHQHHSRHRSPSYLDPASENPEAPLSRYIKELQRLLIIRPGDIAGIEFAACVAMAPLFSDSKTPLWGYLCGPASRGKSEYIMSLKQLGHLIFRDDITPASLVSGYDPDGKRRESIMAGEGDPNPGLASQLDGQCLVIHDLSAAMSKPGAASNYYAFFRAAFDGTFSREVATVGEVRVDAKFGILAGIVPSTMDMVLANSQLAGERFVSCRIGTVGRTVDDVILTGRKLFQDSRMAGGRQALQESVTVSAAEALEQGADAISEGPADADESRVDQVSRIAGRMAVLRTQPSEGTPNIPEGEQRLTQVLQKIAHMRTRLYARQAWNDNDVSFVSRVARDTLPILCTALVHRLANHQKNRGAGSTILELSTDLHRPSDIVEAQLRQWSCYGRLVREGINGRWILDPSALDDLILLGIIDGSDGNNDDDNNSR